MNSVILIVVMSIATAALRFLPFLAFRNRTPKYIAYLGRALPPAMIGMLVIYCLKDISLSIHPFGIPELIAAACVAGAQAWKRNSLISVLAGTVIYMALIQMAF